MSQKQKSSQLLDEINILAQDIDLSLTMSDIEKEQNLATIKAKISDVDFSQVFQSEMSSLSASMYQIGQGGMANQVNDQWTNANNTVENAQPSVSKFTDTTPTKDNQQLSDEIMQLSSDIERTLFGKEMDEEFENIYDVSFNVAVGLSTPEDDIGQKMSSLKSAVESIDYETLPVDHIGKLANHLKKVGAEGREMIDHMNSEMKKIQIERQNAEPSESKFTDTTPPIVEPVQQTTKPSPEQDKLNKKLSAAAWHGDLEEFNELLNDGAEITDDKHYKQGILTRAVLGGNSEIVDKIIASGIDVNQQDDNGATPMSILMEISSPLTIADTVASNRDRDNNIRQHKEYTQMLNSLIAAEGIDINKPDNKGNTPAIIAAENNDKEKLGILIEAKADLSHQNKYGSTALHRALENEHHELADTIIETKPDMDKVDKKGFSPLAIVVPHNGHSHPTFVDLSEKMVKNGASIDVAERKIGDRASEAFTKLREVLSKMKSTISNVMPQQKNQTKPKV